MCNYISQIPCMLLLIQEEKSISRVYRADSRLAPSQWEMLLQSNAVSHWLGANLWVYAVSPFSWGTCFTDTLAMRNATWISSNIFHDYIFILGYYCWKYITNNIFLGVIHVNSSPPSAAYMRDVMRQWIGSALVQIMPCRLSDTKPLPEPVLYYCQLNP